MYWPINVSTNDIKDSDIYDIFGGEIVASQVVRVGEVGVAPKLRCQHRKQSAMRMLEERHNCLLAQVFTPALPSDSRAEQPRSGADAPVTVGAVCRPQLLTRERG